jgi:hypothetical protein
MLLREIYYILYSLCSAVFGLAVVLVTTHRRVFCMCFLYVSIVDIVRFSLVELILVMTLVSIQVLKYSNCSLCLQLIFSSQLSRPCGGRRCGPISKLPSKYKLRFHLLQLSWAVRRSGSVFYLCPCGGTNLRSE